MKVVLRVHGGAMVLGAVSFETDTASFTKSFRTHRIGTIDRISMEVNGADRVIAQDGNLIGKNVDVLETITVVAP